MSVTVRSAAVLDPCHHNGDPFWDGDQTLWELEVEDGGQRDALLFVVARGDAFIPEEAVRRRVEGKRLTLAELRAEATSPGPGRRPQIVLRIEPGEDP